MKRTIRAALLGTLICMLGYIYLPRCGLQIAPGDVTRISFGFAGVFAFFVYRYS
ncbi:MAG TPA: hypothetical protein VMG35_03275 [Bryobacteraceae bacterium]|nr:hypothetical protein [Bryobacteraceae bacterium]